MRRGNGGFEVIGGDGIAGDGAVEVVEPERNQALVPQAAVLILEQHQIAERIDACGRSRRLQRHEGDQRVHSRLGERRRPHEAAEPQGFTAKIVPDQGVA